MDDYRQQQELEEWRVHHALELMRCASLRQLTDSELLDLAAELGLTKQWKQIQYGSGQAVLVP